MGYALHRVDNLPPPFEVVHEQIVLMPEGGFLPVRNPVRKIIFVLSGEGTQEIWGESRQVACMTLRPGDIFILPFQCEQRYIGPNPASASRLHVIRLAFDAKSFPVLPLSPAKPHRETEPVTDDDALIEDCLSELVHLPQGQDEAIQETLAQFRNEARLRLPGYRSRIYGLCLGLTVLVGRKVGERQSSPVSLSGDRNYHVARIKDYLLHHRGQPLELEQVAAHLQLSKEHLSRLFKQATGMTIFEYLRYARIELAKTHLTSTDTNLSEIARLTGFSSLTVFSRTFHQTVGVSPSAYRQQSAGQIG